MLIIIYHSWLSDKKKLPFLYLVDCTTPLGLEDLRIHDSQLTAQSHYESFSIGGGKSVDTEPKCARLNKNNCAWCAPRGNGQYLQVDLRRNFIITGIATQGFEALSNYYVKRYKVSHSRNGHTWSRIFPVSISFVMTSWSSHVTCHVSLCEVVVEPPLKCCCL